MSENETVQFKLVHDYKDNTTYRKSFNKLAKTVFGIDFENFYQSGYWKDRYVCYSYIDKDSIISNVSVNKLDMIINGEKIKALQIGTVMTHPQYRGKGLAGKLINHVLEKYEDEYEIIYLFANKKVLDFYPKYGFKPLKQSQFILDMNMEFYKVSQIRKLDIMKAEDIETIQKLAIKRVPASRILGIDNAHHLLMFYCLYAYGECIYYIDDLEALVIYEKDNGVIHIYDIVSKEKLDFSEIISRIGSDRDYRVVFHFTPDFDDIKLDRIPYDDSDDMLFVKTKTITIPENLFHPTTAHA